MAGYSVTFSVVDDATKQIDAINRRIAQMRAPLDRLSKQVTRFVDVSGLRKVASGFQWIATTAGNVLRTLTAIVPVMGAITGAASIAGMVKLVGQYAAWSHELVAAADNIGTTTQQLQQFEDATRLAGGNAADMRDSLKGLHDNLADFNRGGASAALTGQWANKLGINLKDANGHIRTATDLMPELVKRISELPDPADRAAASAALLGGSGDKLVETFRQSSQSFAQWFNDVKRYKDLTDDQKQSLQRFTEAQGRLGVDFDRLGQQISVMVAEHFGPLLTKFAEFVEKHTPDILKAIDDLSTRFAAWLDSIKWDDVETGVQKFIDSLKWVIDNLDTIKVAAEAIAALFVIKWGVQAVAAIAQVTSAIGSMTGAIGSVGGAAGALEGGAAAAGGVGLLGALGLVAAVVGGTYLLLKKGLPLLFGDRPLPLARPPGEGGTPQATPNTARGGGGERHTERQPIRPGGSGHGGGPRMPPGSVPGVSGLGATPFGDLIARGEGDYNSINSRNDRGSYTPGHADLAGMTVAEVQAQQAAGKIFAVGRYQAIPKTLDAAVKAMGLKGDEKFTPELQDRIFGEYLAGAKRPEIAAYLSGQSNDLQAALKATSAEWASVADPETGQSHYAGVGGNKASISVAEMTRALEATRKQIMARTVPPAAPPTTQTAQATPPPAYQPPAPVGVNPNAKVQFPPPLAAAPPVAVPPQTPPNGAVDVNITHKNPPPNSAVTATGSGSVNVAPVRVEQQDMASI